MRPTWLSAAVTHLLLSGCASRPWSALITFLVMQVVGACLPCPLLHIWCLPAAWGKKGPQQLLNEWITFQQLYKRKRDRTLTFENLSYRTTETDNRRKQKKKKSFRCKIKFLGTGKHFSFKVNNNSTKYFSVTRSNEIFCQNVIKCFLQQLICYSA